jgi:hypothetical protein
MVESVLRLASRGWRLLPCAERAKTPLIRDWPHRASCDADVIRGWALKHGGCNWGVVCCAASDIWVLDVDGDPGLAALADLDKQGYCLPQTLITRTGRGKHLFFRWPSNGTVVRNSAGKLGPCLDARGSQGYCLVPPSVHPNGTVYEFIDENTAIACAPEWLLGLVASQVQRPTTPASEIGILPEGRRNDGLTRLAGALRRKGATEAGLQMALLEANLRRCRPPLTEREVSVIAASAARYEVGGPDPLQVAWQATDGLYISQFEKFVALCRNLQLARPGQPIPLPLERIGVLIGCDWTQVRRWRRRAVAEELLHPVGHYIPHRKAAQYLFADCPTRSVPLSPTSNGLVGHSLAGQSQETPSGTVNQGEKQVSGNGSNGVGCIAGPTKAVFGTMPRATMDETKLLARKRELKQQVDRLQGKAGLVN